MRSIFHLIALLALVACRTMAQPPELHTKNKKAINAFEESIKNLETRKYDDAATAANKAIAEDAKFVEAYFLLGDILTYQNKPTEAIEAITKGFAIDPKAEPKVYQQLAALQRKKGLFADAIKSYESYIANSPKLLPKNKLLTEQRIDTCRKALAIMNKPVPFNPVNAGPMLNSANGEYNLFMTVDEQTAVITVRRPGDDRTFMKGKEEEDIYISYRKNGEWTKARPMSSNVNSGFNEGSASIAPDGSMILYSLNEEDNTKSLGRDIYAAFRDADSWSNPINLGDVVNSTVWDSQPVLAPDGETMFFVSTRQEGKGAADIWTSKLVRTPKGNYFDTPKPLPGLVNTEKDEFSPYLHTDGKTLYFASKGHYGLGGFDLFVSRLQADGTWGMPVNLGYPINSTDDEISSFYVTACSNKGYFSSNRPGGQGGFDIWTIDVPQEAQAQRVTYVKGQVAFDGKGKVATINMVNLDTKQTIATVTADAITGNYLVSLPIGADYAMEISADQHLFYSQNFSLKNANVCEPFMLNATLSPIKAGAITVLRNVFFDADKFDLKAQSFIELDKLVAFLTQNPTLKIEIGGHTDADGDDVKNLTLSDNRAKAVLNYLTSKGIAATRLTAVGYGETKPIAANDTPSNKAQNRRVEFVVK